MSRSGRGRERMLADLRRHGVRDERVLAAMAAVDRTAFVPAALRSQTWADGALPIGHGQTISQPYVVAHMAEVVRIGPEDRVLEIGTGSGYGAAVLGRLAAAVVTVERLEALADAARARLASLGVDNVEVVVGDGTRGWPGGAPYDAVVVTAAGPSVPPSLRAQLAVGGRLVMPVGENHGAQHLVLEERRADGTISERALGGVAFVPLIGAEAWPEG